MTRIEMLREKMAAEGSNRAFGDFLEDIVILRKDEPEILFRSAPQSEGDLT